MSERDDMIAKFEAIVWVTDPRRATRRERQAALARQIARTAIEELRPPRSTGALLTLHSSKETPI